MKINIQVIVLTLTIFTISHSTQPHTLDKIKGALFGGLIGDCLGKPTEFISTVEAQFKRFPHGIRSFEDLKAHNLCWKNKVGELFAPYTDDTAMSLVTMAILLKSKENNWDLNTTMSQLAIAYAQDASKPTGWKMPERAPGNGCIKSIVEITKRFTQNATLDPWNNNPQWWQAGDSEYMGCGSVMRAHPFGLVFADDPEKAATWAAEHSKITHAHPAAQAACAAMAVGIAYAVQEKDHNFIIDQMIHWAKKYDPVEFRYNHFKNKHEKGTWGKIQDATSSALLVNNQGSVAHTLASKFAYSKSFESNLLKNGNSIFEEYEGWSADDAIAAAAYIFALSPNSVSDAIYLGVHTPGDSDSLASMAGALVGARVGYISLKRFYGNTTAYEGSAIVERQAIETAQKLAPLI